MTNTAPSQKRQTLHSANILKQAVWKKRQMSRMAVALIACQVLVLLKRRRHEKRLQREYSLRPRTRRSVAEVYEMLGPYYFRRAFRMSYESFNKLSVMIMPYMKARDFSKATANGPIYHTVGLLLHYDTLLEGHPMILQLPLVSPPQKFQRVFGKSSMQSITART